MNKTLADLFESHKQANSLNLLRYMAALMVIYSHSFPLTGSPATSDLFFVMFGFDGGKLAVSIFFLLSGFLTSYSLAKDFKLKKFFINRFLRIYPGYWVQLLVISISLSMIFPGSIGELFYYCVRNLPLLTGVGYTAGHVFDKLPYPKIINGSLWTLPWELYAYISLAFMAFFFRFCSRCFAILGLILMLGIYAFDLVTNNEALEFLILFWSGVCISQYREFIKMRNIAIFVGFSLCSLSFGWKYLLLAQLSIGMVFLAGLSHSKILTKFNKWGDPSFGVYIYAFPIQQVLISFMPNISATKLFWMSASASSLMGYASWHWVEKKVLTRYKL